MGTINVSVSEPLELFAEREASRAGMASASDYLQQLLQVAREQSLAHDLEQQLLDGIQSGEAVEVDRNWWKAKKEALALKLQSQPS